MRPFNDIEALELISETHGFLLVLLFTVKQSAVDFLLI